MMNTSFRLQKRSTAGLLDTVFGLMYLMYVHVLLRPFLGLLLLISLFLVNIHALFETLNRPSMFHLATRLSSTPTSAHTLRGRDRRPSLQWNPSRHIACSCKMQNEFLFQTSEYTGTGYWIRSYSTSVNISWSSFADFPPFCVNIHALVTPKWSFDVPLRDSTIFNSGGRSHITAPGRPGWSAVKSR